MTRRNEDAVQSGLTAQWLADLLAPIAEEERRCARTLNLVANENRTSDLVLRTQSSELAWRYLLGRPEVSPCTYLLLQIVMALYAPLHDLYSRPVKCHSCACSRCGQG